MYLHRHGRQLGRRLAEARFSAGSRVKLLPQLHLEGVAPVPLRLQSGPGEEKAQGERHAQHRQSHEEPVRPHARVNADSSEAGGKLEAAADVLDETAGRIERDLDEGCGVCGNPDIFGE